MGRCPGLGPFPARITPWKTIDARRSVTRGIWLMSASERAHGDSRRPGTGWSIAALIMTVIAVRLLREGVGPGAGVDPVAAGNTGQQGGQSIFYSFCWLAGALACFRIGRGPGHWLSSATTTGIALTLAGVIAVFTAWTSYAKSSLSSYTQAHGVAETVAVPGGNTSDSPDNTRTRFTVTLPKSVSGHASTAVYTTGFTAVPDDGSTFVIRVDPRDAGYAELPGEPCQTVGETESAAAFAVIALAVGIAGIVRPGRLPARWRAGSNSPSGGPAE